MPVAIVACQTYEESEVQQKIQVCLQHLGGLERFVRPGQTVALKPNLVMKKSPQEAVTTHPSVVLAVAQEVLRVGGKPIICDSPGGPFYTLKGLESIYSVCGLTDIAERAGLTLNFDLDEENCPHPHGEVVKSLPIISPLRKADVIINLPKLKTHSMTTYSGAVKNLYGAIPGMKKAEYHFKMPNYQDFANLLLDINTLLKPTLHIMDGIIGMEGDGPTAGVPKAAHLLLASDNAFDLDTVCIQLMGLAEHPVPTQEAAKRRGLHHPLEQISLLGEFAADQLINLQFRPPQSKELNFLANYLPTGLAVRLSQYLRPQLSFSPELCVGCGECARCCPAQAIELAESLPQIKDAECIRCFCCQELCPHKAVQVKKSWLGRFLFK